ncbi:restriction endonuclease [Filibacter tadaridae]|uniref:Restriction endonuclease n=1 Tax=Filibacter tadaridae TaxID=2483811 RepID=A0A3P5XFZ2_9BACL|nr:restriction endonuclease [Filibacter tadaridae]VDC33705.1 Restriction endonuclease [Filibacter tadaridae]
MAIWINRNHLVGRTSEIIGYKSGLGLTLEEFNDIVPIQFHSLWFGNSTDLLRIRSEEYEELITYLLYKVGNTQSPSTVPSSILLHNKYRNNPELLKMYMDLAASAINFLSEATRKFVENNSKNGIDPSPYVIESGIKYEKKGVEMAIEIMKGFNSDLHRSPWGEIRQINWTDIAQLKNLFESESLETLYGNFIDQRYIDYLSHNFDSIGNIHWRKFEALTCEFFEKQGYYVEIGEGRNDDGIDARLWTHEIDKLGPPTIIIQCKRYKDKIEKMVVKSLWADIQEYGAESGLLVTTSSLSPGAEKVCTARNYPITQVNRETLKLWIKVMRTPYKGVFMAE